MEPASRTANLLAGFLERREVLVCLLMQCQRRVLVTLSGRDAGRAPVIVMELESRPDDPDLPAALPHGGFGAALEGIDARLANDGEGLHGDLRKNEARLLGAGLPSIVLC